MKVLIVFAIAAMAICAQAHISEDQKAKMKKSYTECVESSGVEKEIISKARKGEFTEDPKLMNYYACMMDKMDFLDAEGNIHPENIKANLPDSIDAEEGAKNVDKCCKADATGSKDKKAFACYKCFVESLGKEIKFF